MKKKIFLHPKVEKELNKIPHNTREELQHLFKILSDQGKLELPYGKKITKDLFEIRIRHKDHWRAIYAYIKGDIIIIVSLFKKKTNKTPLKELKKVYKRLLQYEKE
jgi:phage-related protein